MQLTATMKSSESIKDIYDRQAAEVRRNPKRAEHRISLFQLFCIQGDWDRALAQLSVLAELVSAKDEDLATFTRTYDALIRCERHRLSVFAGERQPLLIGEPDPWIAYLLQALALDQQGHSAEAEALRDKAFEEAPVTAFLVNETQQADWLADADSRFGPMFEACLNGKYYWIPFSRVTGIAIEPPADLRDLIWMPARITFDAGGEEVAFLPLRYPGSESADDEGIKLARRTEWLLLSGNYYKGLGQHMWTSGDEDFALLDVRSIKRAVA